MVEEAAASNERVVAITTAADVAEVAPTAADVAEVAPAAAKVAAMNESKREVCCTYS